MKTVRLGDMCDILDSKRMPVTKKDRQSGPYPYYGATGIQDYVANYIFNEPLILVGEDGAKWGAHENTAFAISGKTWVNNHAHVLRPNRELVLDSWIVYYINSTSQQDYITGVTVPKLNQAMLRQIPIPLPSLEEQRRVVERLDAAFEKIDRAIELTEKNIEKINSLRLVATRNLLERVDGQEKTVGEVIKLEYGKPLDRADRKNNGKFAAYGANGIKDMTDRYYWDAPSIIVGRKGSAGELTRVDEPFWPLDVTYYVTHDNTETNLDYIFYMLDSLNLPSHARGVKPGINRNDVYSLPFKLPVIEEQEATAKKIYTLCEQTKNLTEQHRNKVVTLKALKQSLLTQAFSQSEVE